MGFATNAGDAVEEGGGVAVEEREISDWSEMGGSASDEGAAGAEERKYSLSV